MKRLLVILSALMLTACTPLVVQQAGRPDVTFQGPRLGPDGFVSFDGTRLGLTTWEAKTQEPWAVVIGVHGMNDYANAFHLAAPWWAEQGVTTYAYDQRGFGRSPDRGVWGGDELMVEDLRTIVALAKARHPKAVIVVAGESMGGAVTIEAFSSDRPPAADRVVLLSPAVWGWSNQPLPYKTTLWFAARLTGPHVYEPPEWLTKRVFPTNNREELIAMGRDPLMIWGARSDTLYGLVAMMERAWRQAGEVKVPALYLYGAHDQIIPKRPAFQASHRLKPGDRTAYYAEGWHLMTRDRQGPKVWADILSYIRDPAAPLPSGAPPIPAPESLGHATEGHAGL
ncbi:alpha/beta hydrolase [Phenylobacterium aquaticum]|uniref:alpha/beta hydrolase n=1 Tax=Phenylobacterium aquaticum TaxID=1763816 RepID=UPI0026EB88F0|nr:alpha/beta hydrolase [Phenylobacterium aquaticum]